jgi:hypothetical protein
MWDNPACGEIGLGFGDRLGLGCFVDLVEDGNRFGHLNTSLVRGCSMIGGGLEEIGGTGNG